MLINFNPQINKKINPNFKSLKDGLIDPKVVSKYSQATILPGIIKMGGGYKPTADNFSKNLEALEEAKKIAGLDKRVGNSIIALLNDSIEILKEEAKRLGVIK